jgi:hypothetical protein
MSYFDKVPIKYHGRDFTVVFSDTAAGAFMDPPGIVYFQIFYTNNAGGTSELLTNPRYGKSRSDAARLAEHFIMKKF